MRKRKTRKRARGHTSPANWPTVEEQLAAANVVSGSRLEELIRNNQELEMLRPEEANDKVGLPPWVRIYWQKKHPEGKYVGPSGGYPLLLKQCYEWMLAHQDLPGHDVSGSSAKSNQGQHAK